MDGNYLISRQPVFGAKLNVVAYDVQTRPLGGSGSSGAGTEADPVAMFTDTMLNDIVGPHDCFISVPSGISPEDLSTSLPKSRLVLGLSGYQVSDTDAQQTVRLLDAGYRVIVPDTLPSQGLALLANRVHAIRIDVVNYTPAGLEERVRNLRAYKTKLVATNVGTYDDLEFCKALAFDFFEGRFISRAASQGKEVPLNRLALMRVLAKLQQPDIGMKDLEELVSQDVALSFKLLRYANSASIALPRKVASIGHAVRLLGLDMLRNWTRVLLMSAVEDKPRELMTIALVRGRMCERLSEPLKNAQKESFFSAGLLSVLDALLDCPMEKAIAELPLIDELKMALTDRTGQIGQALRCTLAYERADWDEVQFYGLPPLPIRDIYIEAISWAQQMTTGLLT